MRGLPTRMMIAPMCLVLLAACIDGTGSSPDIGSSLDADTIADTDGGDGTVTPDTDLDLQPPDVAVDTTPPDAAIDTGADAAADPGVDTPPDVTPDEGSDAATDTTADTGPTDTVVADEGGPTDTAVADDGGAGDSGPTDSGPPDIEPDGEFEYPTLTFPACETLACKTPLPSVGSYYAMAFRVVRWDTDTIVITNKYGQTVDLTAWKLCRGIGLCTTLPAISVPDNGKVTIDLVATGTDTATDAYLGNPTPGWDLGNIGELALFDGTEMQAFVRWGAAPFAGEPSLTTEAVTTFLTVDTSDTFWPGIGQFIDVCDEAGGFIAVGNIFAPGGYNSMPSNCPNWNY